MTDLGAGILGVSGVIVTALASGAAVWIKARSQARAADAATEARRDKSALGPLREALDRQQKQIEQRDSHIVELSEAFDQLSEEHSVCQVEQVEMYGHFRLLHDFAARVARACRRLGEDPGDVPPMPPPPSRPDRQEAEFRRRQLQQSTELLKSGVVPPPPPPPPPPQK